MCCMGQSDAVVAMDRLMCERLELGSSLGCNDGGDWVRLFLGGHSWRLGAFPTLAANWLETLE
jgi:hypothetical protein